MQNLLENKFTKTFFFTILGLNWNNGPGGSSYYPGGGINWNRPHGIGGSSYFPGGYHHNRHHRPGGRFGHRGKRSAQPQSWSTSNSNYKPDYNNGGKELLSDRHLINIVNKTCCLKDSK